MPISRSCEQATQPPSALREFFGEHGAFVSRSLRYLGVPEVELEDAVQEVFLVVHQQLKDYERRRRATAWLYSTCRRVAAEQRRGRNGHAKTEAPGFLETAAVPNHLEALEDREAWALIRRLLDQLPEAERDVFSLYELENFPMWKVAQELECPIQTAYSRLYRARSRMLAKVEHMAVPK
jgi:RNA polymerase sigma-70 factor (ECF subfamily)